jgi:diguanylate cyclase (GGDEF)-like protein
MTQTGPMPGRGRDAGWPAVPGLLVRISERIEEQPRPRVYALCGLLLAAAFAADVATGPELAWSVFYTVPIAIAAWHLGWTQALLSVALGAAAWLAADTLAGATYVLPAAQYWNTAVRAACFLVVAYMLTLLRYALQHERELARTDWLTGLPNTRSFIESAAHEIARTRRAGTPLTMAYLDLNGFKAVNDTLGHAAGDDLLRRIGRELRRHLRDVDIVARLGGDEFAVLLPDTDGVVAKVAIDRLHAAIRVVAAETNLPVDFSVGSATSSMPPDADDMLRAADMAMYEAKRQGRGRSVYVDLEATAV